MHLIRATVNGQILDFERSISNKKDNSNQYYLGKNYPNPFNNKTAIPYEIKQPCRVKIYVFDLRGNLVNIIMDKFQNIGKYSIEWDASRFSSGIYIYSFEIDNFREYRKCLLIK